MNTTGRRVWKTGTFVLIAALAGLALGGCATLQGRNSPDSAAAKTSATTAVNADPYAQLERELQGARADRVTVSANLLREILRRDKVRTQKYQELVSQLRALKTIDLEETVQPTGDTP